MKTSEQINELASALAKAQGAIKNASKDSDNPFFKSKYADLAAVWEACRSELSTNGLSVSQVPEITDGKVSVHTMLMHSSGQWISGELAMAPVKSDPQGIGSCLTYIRRYALSAIVGIAPEDDDGNAASGKSNQQNKTETTITNKSSQSTVVGGPKDVAYISDAQRKRFFALCSERHWTDDEAKKMLMDFGVFSSKNIPVKDYERICKIVETHDFNSYIDVKNNPPAKAV